MENENSGLLAQKKSHAIYNARDVPNSLRRGYSRVQRPQT